MVYSLHKTSTRPYIARKAAEWGASAEVVAELQFEIKRMYKHHTNPSLHVEVDFWRLQQGAAHLSQVDSGERGRAGQLRISGVAARGGRGGRGGRGEPRVRQGGGHLRESATGRRGSSRGRAR